MIRLLPIALFVGCATPITPNSVIDCDVDASAHPANDELQARIDDVVSKGIPGIAVAVETSDGVWQGAAGHADLENDVAMNPCHVHPWASVGKTWTAVLAMRLVDEGVLGLDDRVADWLPAETLDGLANIDQITLRQLMNHSSGLKDFNEDFGYLGWEFDNPFEDDPPERMLDFVRGDAARFEPGQGYHYTDTAYVLLAMVIDAATSDRVAAMAEYVFEPLGLANTELPVGGADPVGRVNSYWELPGGQLENISELQGSYDVQIIGAGNLRSTPADSLRFVRALATGALLTPASQEALLTWNRFSEDDDGSAYALGVTRREVELDGAPTTWVGHFGGDVGASAAILARSDEPIGVVAVLNLGGFLGGPLNEHVGDAFIDEMLRIASE